MAILSVAYLVTSKNELMIKDKIVGQHYYSFLSWRKQTIWET